LQLLHRFLAGALVLLAGVVLIGGMAHIRLYWMLPMLTVAPLVFFARLQDSSTTRWQWRGFTAAVLAVVGIVAVARVAKARNHEDQDVLFQELAQELRTHGFHGGPVLTLGHREAANLRLHFPDARVVCTEYPAFVLPDATGRRPHLLLWDASHFDGLPGMWRPQYRKRIAPFTPSVPIHYVTPPEASGRSRIARLGYVLFAE
jgi:hypothetical protein